ncbi:MAG: hypothetical protein KH441_12045 [Clostridium sp.]|nr:hypothetical protein [Clostridium sp.]MEE1495965.1 hypothetical protein [Clostridium sp.]
MEKADEKYDEKANKLLKINKNFFRLLIFEKKTLYYGYAMQEGSGSFLSSDRQEDL